MDLLHCTDTRYRLTEAILTELISKGDLGGLAAVMSCLFDLQI